jgi:ATP-dependent Lon protease
MQNAFFTDHYGFDVDYHAEALRELRRYNQTEAIDHHFALGGHLNARDAKAVRRTVSGLVKLIHPDGGQTKEELRDYVELAIEARRRVKEQLKKMGAFEYYQTSFSYRDLETQQEIPVGVPEEGGRALIAPDSLPPGSVYAASFAGDHVAVQRLEVGRMPGSGKLRITGGVARPTRESIQTAFDYLKGSRSQLGIEKDVESYDFHVQVVDLIAGGEGSQTGVAFFVALLSLLREQPVQSGLVVLGEMTIHGNIVPVQSLAEPLQLVMDNGAKKVLLPTANKRDLLEVPGDIVERVDSLFYSDPVQASVKALGLV